MIDQAVMELEQAIKFQIMLVMSHGLSLASAPIQQALLLAAQPHRPLLLT